MSAPGETVIRYELPGQPTDILGKLLERDEAGRVTRFGRWSARPRKGPVAAPDLADWVRFSDHIMEGFVEYDLRVVEQPAGVRLELRLLGTSRDEHVPGFTEWSFDQLGLRFQRAAP